MSVEKNLFPEREREHEHVHARSVERQILDALLRQEELLQKLVDAGAIRIHDEVQVDLSEPKQAKIIKEAVQQPLKRKPNPTKL